MGKPLAVVLCGILIPAVFAADADAIDPSAAAAAAETAASRLASYEGRPRVNAIRMNADEKITLDGHLDEAVWKRAIPATDFTQQDPKNGELPTERTEVRFIYDEHNLYMGVYCYDSEPNKLMGNQILRDGFLSADDRFQWVFDTYLNARTGYFFEVNPSGAMGDSLIGSSNGRAWDGIWTANIKHFDQGWIIEVQMPFRTLNFDPSSPAWGVNFQRTVRRKQEEMLWSAWQRNQGLQSLRYAGLLTGITEASQGVGLDIRPYFINKYTALPGLNIPGDWTQKAGVDIYYSLTPQLRANLTINTDFAETEVDQRQVNLSQFPLFYPERRTFFLEGSGFFDFGRWPNNTAVVPFFSRRIGLNNGLPQRIDFGAKVTGQIGAYDVGALQVRTARDDRNLGEDFSVFRGRRRFFRESYFGGIYTRRSTRVGESPNAVEDRHTAGADVYIGTSKFRGNKNLQFSAFYLWTSNVNTNLQDKGSSHYGVRIDYPNDRWNLRLGYRSVQEAYDPAVGFYDRRGIKRSDVNVFWNPRPKNNKLVRRYTIGAGGWHNLDANNRHVNSFLDIQVFGVEFQSGDSFYGGVTPVYDRLQFDFNIYTGVKLPVGTSYNYWRYWFGGSTANRRSVSVNGQYSGGTFYSGTRRDITVGIGIRPRPGVLLTYDNHFTRVELPEGSFSTAVPRMTAVLQFGPWKSLTNNVQYDTVSRVLGWQSRFRWIVKPGNDIYIVYQHNWISDPAGLRTTFDRGFATKVNVTKRF